MRSAIRNGILDLAGSVCPSLTSTKYTPLPPSPRRPLRLAVQSPQQRLGRETSKLQKESCPPSGPSPRNPADVFDRDFASFKAKYRADNAALTAATCRSTYQSCVFGSVMTQCGELRLKIGCAFHEVSALRAACTFPMPSHQTSALRQNATVSALQRCRLRH